MKEYYYQIFCSNGRFYGVWEYTEDGAIKLFEREHHSGIKRHQITKILRCWIPPLCGEEWLKEHEGQHSDFVPTILLKVDGAEYNLGKVDKGVVKKFLKLTKEHR
jgi:hypothetical protein